MDKIKSKLTTKTITIIAISVVVVIAIVAGVMLLNGGGSDTSSETKSIFIKNDKDMYAIYTVKGEKVSDYDFSDNNKFINGTALVSNKKDQKGIVSSDGDMIVDFGEYDYIFRDGPLYSVSSYRDNKSESFILNSKGEKIQEKGKAFIIRGIIIGDDKEYRVVDMDGETITSFKNAGEDIDEPDVVGSDRYVVISYNGKVYLIDYENSKELVSFKDKRSYAIDMVNPKNKDQIILVNTNEFYETKDEENYIIIDDGDIAFQSKGKYTDVRFDFNNNILANLNEKPVREYIDVNGKVLFKHESSIDVIYSTPTECVLEERADFKYYVRFYNNGKLVKSIEDAAVNKMAFTYIDLYPVYSFETRGYQYYNSKGEVIIKELFSRASGFHENELAIVTDSNDKTFLIDKEGKRVGKKYDSLYTSSDKNSYEVYNKVYYKAYLDDTYYILDQNGKVIVKEKYDNVDIHTVKDKEFLTFKKDNKYGVYDLQEKKVLATSKDYFVLEDDYIFTYTSKGMDYYTYGGEKIGE